jgi:protein-S-isoprenylcysteine O-methyltransferase Ste14
MNIKLILIISFSILYGLFELLLSRRNQADVKIIKSGDKRSILLLTICITLGYWLSFIMASTKTGRIYQWNILFLIGSIVVLSGLIIRVTSIIKLKQHFTYTVVKLENHELIETGLYKSIRHPGYLGQLIIFLGTSICLSNWASMIIMIILVLVGYLNRINVEEKFMSKELGQKYVDYQTRTKRLIPMIY